MHQLTMSCTQRTPVCRQMQNSGYVFIVPHQATCCCYVSSMSSMFCNMTLKTIRDVRARLQVFHSQDMHHKGQQSTGKAAATNGVICTAATCILFGDGTGAVVLTAQQGQCSLLGMDCHSDGSGQRHLNVSAPATTCYWT